MDAINEMLEVQIAECEGDHTARDRAENRYNQEASSFCTPSGIAFNVAPDRSLGAPCTGLTCDCSRPS